MRRFGFTLIELIFVILLLGILAATAVSRSDSDDDLYAAADQLANHIRYTRHLAMIEDPFDPMDSEYTGSGHTGEWYRARWQIMFSPTYPMIYIVFSDRDRGGQPSDDEIAFSPMDQEPMGSVTSKLGSYEGLTNLGSRYNVTSVTIENYAITGGNTCTTDRVMFDTIGRPHCSNPSGPYEKLAMETIVLNINHAGGRCRIQIQPVTGYVSDPSCN